MNIIKSIRVKNFRCFRKSVEFDFLDGSYLIGANNSGKSAILNAIRFFFDGSTLTKDDFNNTELRSKQSGYNRCEIDIIFDLNNIKNASSKIKSFKKKYSDVLTIKKIYLYRESSDDVSVFYSIASDDEHPFTEIPEDVRWFLSRFIVSYIHPQDADKLLIDAEEKLRRRLINTFGRGAGFIKKMKDLEESWNSLRDDASRSLSENLTTALRTVWDDAQVKIDLPEKIQDILTISSISFRQSASQPEIILGRQGNGIQAAVLFQAHYILDSDKTAHRGFYCPIWLIEEPETFLHADISLRLGAMLSSDEWRSNIQMIITTHSPLILAASNQNPPTTKWIHMKNFSIAFMKSADQIVDSDLVAIGSEMGDVNFDIYFDSNFSTPQLILEDSRSATFDVLRRSNVSVTKKLNGTSDVKKYIDTVTRLGFPIRNVMVFLMDKDDGAKEFNKYFTVDNLIKEIREFCLYKIAEKIYILTLPELRAVEDLFDEFDDYLGEAADVLFDDEWINATSGSVPGNMSRAHAAIRNKRAGSRQHAKSLLSKEQDIKDGFWKKIHENSYSISEENTSAINELFNIASAA